MKYQINRTDGKDITGNTYLVVNTDESYAGRIADMIEAYERSRGSWDHGENSLREVMGIADEPILQMEAYKSWDFCKSIDCINMRIESTEVRKKQCSGSNCAAYRMHQYLREHGQILEEGSDLEKLVAGHESEIEEWRHNQDMCFKTAEEDGKKIKDVEAQLAEAQADNAALVETVKIIIDIPITPSCMCDESIGYVCPRCRVFIVCHECLNKTHPGADLLKELEQYKRALSLLLDNLFEMDDDTCPANVDGEQFPCDEDTCGIKRPYKKCWLKFYLDQAQDKLNEPNYTFKTKFGITVDCRECISWFARHNTLEHCKNCRGREHQLQALVQAKAGGE